MPTYDYVCDKCNHEFELFQSMKDDPLDKCPECKSKKVRRLIGGGAGIIFKGSGFYETDYKRKEQPKSKNESASASESKSETKPDSKKDSSSGDKKDSKKTAAA
ncbi:MAG: zinc ribbon domain-containing protein [Candidatus Hinthialibacter antarcticus]|nr:zinc ribbon domain-containing protein [Candidatus Hinthialibacter antarcticus]